MPQNKSVNTFEKGMVKVDNPTKQPKNSYPFALNVIINDIVTDPTSRTNEKSLDLYYKPNGDTNTNILGYIWLGTEEYVLFIKNLDGEAVYNKILYINVPKNITKQLYSSTLLNFQDNYEIKGTYRINYKNQRIIYWVDGLNDDRVLNIDIDNSALDISLIAVGESAKKPIIEATVLDTGGSITTGQYFIASSYNFNEDITTSPQSISNAISIGAEPYYNNISITPAINRDFGATDGDLIPVPTNKSIQVNISNLDNKYTSYNLLIIKVNVDGTYSFKVIKNIAITTNQFIYNGNQGEIDESITLNDIIVDTIKYYASEAITQKDNRLVRGNTKIAANNVDYQEFANNIVVEYEITEEQVFNDDQILNNPVETQFSGGGYSYDIPATTFKKHSISPSYLANTANNDQDNKSFIRDEVYSLGIGFELIDGSETPVYHIPGRIADTVYSLAGTGEYGRAMTANWDTSISPYGNAYWRDMNTALSGGILAYWRSDEVYTDGYNFPTNGEKNSDNRSYIRHHKMPSDVLEPLFRTEIVGDQNATNTYTTYRLYKRHLGLRFSNIQIPEQYQGLVNKIKFFYTPRDTNNKSIISKGILYKLEDYNGSKKSSQQSQGGLEASNNLFEFISPDVNFKFKEAPLQGTKIKVNSLYKGFINYVGRVPDNYSGAHMSIVFNTSLSDETGRRQKSIMSSIPYLQSAVPKLEIYSRPLSKALYIDDNFVGSTEGLSLDFMGNQDTSVLQLSDPLIAKPTVVTAPLADYYPTLGYPAGSNNPTEIQEKLEETVQRDLTYQNKRCFDTTYYVSIINDNRSLYGKIESLVYTNIHNTVYTPGSSPYVLVNKGDTFVDMHHFKKSYVKLIPTNLSIDAINLYNGGTEGSLFVKANEWGSYVFGSFMCETDINIRMRREGEGQEGEYFPKSMYAEPNFFTWQDITCYPEFYKIEDSYNRNFLKLYFANTVKQDELSNTGTRYSTRIVYSDKQELEDKIDNYRIARANNYRDLPLNRGPITIFFTKQDKLYTVTRDSLFDVFASNQTIKSENADNIVVGTGEFLSIEPVELISIDGGYGGSTSKFSLVESPYGYLFVDRHKNKCLLFNDQFKDINDLGLNENFKLELFKQFPELEVENGFDNPLTVGIIATYDPELKRLIITKKDYKLINNVGTITFSNGYIYRDGIKLDYSDINIFENKSFTVSYDAVNSQWISYHSYIPKNYLSHNTDFLTFNNNELRKSNGEDYTAFTIETVFNENPLYTKTFDALNINAESFDNEERSNDFFTSLLVYNDQQSSDIITLDSTNLTRKEKDWNIHKFLDKTKDQAKKPIFSKDWVNLRDDYYIDKVVNPAAIDLNKPWYRLARFRDKYLIARFSYNSLEMKKIIVNFVNTIYRVSTR